jgi:hypothetical protein
VIEDSVQQLIRLRGGSPPESATAIFTQITDPERLGDLFEEILDRFSRIAARLRTDLSLSMLYAELADVAEYDQSLDRRDAADIIASFRWFSTSVPELKDLFAADIQAVLNAVSERGRATHVIVAIPTSG